jgi:hypothetical protein
MNLSSQLALTIASVTALGTMYPLTASAAPVVGSTAAAVSIEFQSNGTTNGNFAITPTGSTNSNISGVKEISAAIATGETRATATTGISASGTTATAEGYSQPVAFKFNGTSNVTVGANNITTAASNYEYAGSTTGLTFLPVK